MGLSAVIERLQCKLVRFTPGEIKNTWHRGVRLDLGAAWYGEPWYSSEFAERTSAVSKMPPPLLGFNNNVRHRGRIFHIQTEDSGVKHPRIVTHLFADGGRIVKTTRTDYSEHLGRSDMNAVLRQMMKEQHKSMFIALRAGELDELIVKCCGPLPSAAAPNPAAAAIPAPAPAAAPVIAAENVARAEPPPAGAFGAPVASPLEAVAAAVVESLEETEHAAAPPPLPRRRKTGRRVASGEELGEVVEEPATPAPLRAAVRRRTSRPPEPADSGVLPAASEAPALYAPSRPAAIFEVPRAEPPRSLFGDNLISEKSLDEVILSYLAEDLEEASQD